MNGDVGQGALVGLFSPVWRLCPFVPRDVLVLVFWWGWSQGEGFYTVEGDGVFPGPVGQDVYTRVSGTVPRYMLPVMVGAGSGWRRDEVHEVEQGGSWCSHRGWSMPYGVTCTAKGPTARWSLWGWMLWRRATARVWERPSLIHTASARDAAGFRQSVVMPAIVRLWVVSDTLAGGALMRGMVWSSWRVRALRLASCRCWASWAGVCTPVCLGFLLGRSAVWKGVGQEGAWWRLGCGRSPRVAHVYRVVAAAPSACMVYRSSCRRRVTRTLGVVSSYTCVVWGRWRVTVILAASFLQVVVWGMM